MKTIRSLDKGSAWIIGPVMLALIVWGLLTLPIPAMAILGGAALVAFVVWLRTGYRRPVESKSVIAAYLGAVAFQIIHLSEEWNGDFPHEFVDLVGSSRDWSLDSFLWIFVFAFVALWVIAAAGVLYQLRVANYFLWFYALGAGLINAIAHFVFPIAEGGYFPGLITAPGHLILSILLIRWLVIEDRMLRERETRQKSRDPEGREEAPRLVSIGRSPRPRSPSGRQESPMTNTESHTHWRQKSGKEDQT